jgi:hypothetical protein
MKNRKKVKTYQPILDTNRGAVCEEPRDAFYGILLDMSENNKHSITDNKIYEIADDLAKLFGIDNWADGIYQVMDEVYQIKVHTYQQWQLDEMGEFNGY